MVVVMLTILCLLCSHQVLCEAVMDSRVAAESPSKVGVLSLPWPGGG